MPSRWHRVTWCVTRCPVAKNPPLSPQRGDIARAGGTRGKCEAGPGGTLSPGAARLRRSSAVRKGVEKDRKGVNSPGQNKRELTPATTRTALAPPWEGAGH